MIAKKKIEKILSSEREGKIFFKKMEDYPIAHEFKHSWAGSQGVEVFALNIEARKIRCIAKAETYSQNGRIIYDKSPIPPEDYLRGMRKGEIVAIYKWDYYNNPIREYEEWHVDIADYKVSTPYTIRISTSLKDKLIKLGAKKVIEILEKEFQK